jgi:plastocyanin
LHINRLVVAAACLVALSACAPDPNDAMSANTTAPPAPTVAGETTAPQTTSAVSYPANGKTTTINAIDNNFGPQNVTVTAGTKITFHNSGKNVHNVKPKGDPNATTWGVLDGGFAPGSDYSRVVDHPGTYVYYCSIHGTPKAGMFGTITVTSP